MSRSVLVCNVSDPEPCHSEITWEYFKARRNEKDAGCWLDICHWCWKEEEKNSWKDLCIKSKCCAFQDRPFSVCLTNLKTVCYFHYTTALKFIHVYSCLMLGKLLTEIGISNASQTNLKWTKYVILFCCYCLATYSHYSWKNMSNACCFEQTCLLWLYSTWISSCFHEI